MTTVAPDSLIPHKNFLHSFLMSIDDKKRKRSYEPTSPSYEPTCPSYENMMGDINHLLLLWEGEIDDLLSKRIKLDALIEEAKFCRQQYSKLHLDLEWFIEINPIKTHFSLLRTRDKPRFTLQVIEKMEMLTHFGQYEDLEEVYLLDEILDFLY